MTVINIFDGPIREYKTKKAAERFAKRLVKGGYIKKNKSSFFGFPLKQGQYIFSVYENDTDQETQR